MTSTLNPARPPSPTRSKSPFLPLGVDIFENILTHLCNEPFPHASLSTDGLRLLLPFALTCTSHYVLFTHLTRRLAVLPVGYTTSFRPPSSDTIPVPFAELFPPPTGPPSSSRRHRRLCPSINPASLECGLRVFPNLTSLHLSRAVKVGDEALGHIARAFPALRELRLPGNVCVSVDGLSAVAASCRRLRTLDLSYCKSMGDETAPVLLSMPVLASLSVSYWKISDEFVAKVATIPTLTTLSLSVCTRLTKYACVALRKNAKNLEELKVRCASGLRDNAIREVAHCSLLKTLDLSQLRNISDDGIAALGDSTVLPLLRTVLLSQCVAITDAGVNLLARNKAIRFLDLSHCELLTDACAKAIRGIKSLQGLDVSGCDSLSDCAVIAFSELSCLNFVGLRYCTRLTYVSVDALSRSPSVPIETIDIRKCPEISVEGLETARSACTLLLG